MTDEMIIWYEIEDAQRYRFKASDRRGRRVCELEAKLYVNKDVNALFYEWDAYDPSTGTRITGGMVKGPRTFRYDGPFIEAQDEAESAYRQWQEQNQ